VIWPPSILRIRILEKGKGIRLWLPIFLLWPLIGLVVLIAPIFMLASRPITTKAVLFSGPALLVLFCRLRGLRIDVRDGSDQVHIAFI